MRNCARAIASLFFAFAVAQVCAAQSSQKPVASGSVAALPANAAELDPKSWREFAPPGSGFSILFPGTPESTTHVARDANTGQPVNTITHRLKTFATYSVSDGDYIVPLDDPATAPTALDQFIKGIASKLDAETLSQSNFTLDGHPGRAGAWRLPDGKMLRGKVLLVGQRAYTILVSMPDEQGATPQAAHFYEETANKFLDSFKLVPVAPMPQGEVDRYLAGHSGEFIGSPSSDNGGATSATNTAKVTEGKVISRPEPDYPPIARAARAQGQVVVRIVADEEGKVVAAQVVSGHPLLQESALRAARKLRFRPPLMDGKPVKFSGTITYTFRLR